VVLETVKKAEKDAGLILRVAETHGRHSTGRLEIDFPNFTLEETDLMERAVGRRLEAAPAAVLRMAPFEIRTLRLTYDTAQ
ncbi:MAG TPA: glycosyl hydrolase-related protein, partial [candidate division Zixibacteria bacterium]|nr:glycosyl hydrolase-related protein [candidate division Zixibacteria bacterium]